MSKIVPVKPTPTKEPPPTNPPPNNPPPSTITVNVTIDPYINSIINSLTNTVNSFVQSYNKTDDLLMNYLNKSVNELAKQNSSFIQVLNKTLDNQVNILNNTISAITEKSLKPLITNLADIERQELDFERKAQVSNEALLKRLIDTQTQQTTELKNTLTDLFDNLIETMESIDYVSEENLADWIKQAFQPLRIDIPNSLKQVDESGQFNPFNPLQPLIDALNYLVDRVRNLRNSFDKLENGDYSTIEAFRNDIFGSNIAGQLGEDAFFMLMLVPLFKEIGVALFSKMFTELHFLAIRNAEPTRLTNNEMFEMLVRGEINYDEFSENAKDLGIPQELISKIYRTSFELPDITTLFELYRRKEIGLDVLKSSINGLGFNQEWTEKLVNLAFYQAPPQDIIRFMVRDVFNPVLVESGQLAQGGDNPKYLELAEKVGVSKELALYYWMAHWILPSYNQGYELFQREKISREQLEQLFVAGDLAPAWREPMLSISYSLPTRVDVRRAYEDGIIDDDKLKEFIKHSGVEPEWRDAIFEWHKERKLKLQTSKSSVKSLSLSQIIKGYLNGVFTQSLAVQKIQSLGYTLEDAIELVKIYEENQNLKSTEEFTTKIRQQMRDMGIEGYRARTLSHKESLDLIRQSGISEDLGLAMLSLIDHQYRIDRKNEIVQATRKLYLGYDISENRLYTIMQQNGFTKEEIDSHISDLKPLRELRYKELTRADIKKGTKIEGLGIEWGKERLKGLGYSDSTIKEIMLIEQWEDNQNSFSVNGDIELFS